ncbi:MAG: hypothetical protein LC689_19550 [Myxococcales bacterium]|nr:hypothetical protein [Myxococcales bacterium]
MPRRVIDGMGAIRLELAGKISVSKVAGAIMTCIRDGAEEIAVPWLSGNLRTLGYLSPRVRAMLQPSLERRGAKAKRAYIERKRAR